MQLIHIQKNLTPVIESDAISRLWIFAMDDLVRSFFRVAWAKRMWEHQNVVASYTAQYIIGIFIALIGSQIFLVLVKPYRSPLRNLPGPKVSINPRQLQSLGAVITFCRMITLSSGSL
jgi:hypothetical protein